MADGNVLCGYCLEPIESEAVLDDHLPVCPKRPLWLPRPVKK